MGLYDDDENDSDLVKDLRKQLRDKATAEKAAAEQLASLSKVVRERTIKDVLTEKGVNLKVASLIPADVEPTEDAVTAWVDTFGDVFGITPAQKSEANPPDAGAFQRAQALEQGGQTPPDAEAQFAALVGAKSEQELMALIAGAQR